ncbi:Nuclear protein export factor [Pseudoloma neurophilia]|uniref:Nuclear protein export factor n=1 Tax=Pseudoloma neurophilia TaxID=146866 RepID=A0A0R0M2X8_9MICR|nr:Nuclear protein export factor [Pseudoloma neurophilia]
MAFSSENCLKSQFLYDFNFLPETTLMDINLKEEYDRLVQMRSEQVPPVGTVVGECQEFCSYFETVERKLRNDVSVFEKNLMIKKYVRSAAGKTKALPSDIRPLEVLLSCFNHLLTILQEYCDLNDNLFESNNLSIPDINERIEFENLESVKQNASRLQHPYNSRWCIDSPSLLELYKFLEDRIRAIRLDISIQELSCDRTVNLLERICNFYIIFNFLLHEHPRFEEHLNLEQIKKIIITLKQFYEAKKQFVLTFEQQRFHKFDILLSIEESLTDSKENVLFDREKILSADFNHSNAHPKIDRYPDIANSRRLVIEIARGNHPLFYEYFKQADFLTKCFLTTQLKKLLKSASNMYKTAFFERVPSHLILNWYHLKDPSFFIAEGVPLEDGHFSFRSRPFKPIELKYKLLPHLDFKLPKCIKLAINLSQRDIYTYEIIKHDLIKEIISKRFAPAPVTRSENTAKKTRHKQPPTNNITEVVQIVERKHEMEKILDVDRIILSIYHEFIHRMAAHQLTRLYFSKRKDLIELWQEKSKQQTEEPSFCLVVERVVSAAMLSQKIKKKYPNIKILHYHKNIEENELLKYKAVVFIVNSELRRRIESQFYMLNMKFLNYQEKDLNFTSFLNSCKKVKVTQLRKALDGKSDDDKLRIMCTLVSNRRNKHLQQVIPDFTNKKILANVPIYYFDDNELL